MKCQIERLLDKSKIFSGLELEERKELKKDSSCQEFRSGELIFQEGEPAFGLYIMDQGLVKLAKRSWEGKNRILKLLGPRDILGEEILSDQKTYTAYAETMERTRTVFLPKEIFLPFLQKHLQVALNILEKLSWEIKAFQSKLVETSYGGAEERLARILCTIADKCGKEEDGLHIGVELKRKELAEMAGISKETAIRALSQFQKRGWIKTSGRKIYIRDKEALKKTAESNLLRVIEKAENIL